MSILVHGPVSPNVKLILPHATLWALPVAIYGEGGLCNE